MDNTESQIKAAINARAALSGRKTPVLAQGSFKNLTHIPRESDVDIRVVLMDSFFYDFQFVDPNATVEAMFERFGISKATYSYDEFRDDVGAALVDRFGQPPAVDPGDKAFRIRETRYHVDADVVAALQHRRYNADGTFEEGVEFRSRKGKKIINWPEQQFRNGITKNQNTGERFKAMVRALKNLRAEMEDEGKAVAKPIPSFLIECLVWNVPNDRFNHKDSYYEDMKAVLTFVYNATKSADAGCMEWHEESDLKWLFKGEKGWTREEANAFILGAWRHVGFTN
jgi:hypothetical protein